ncbi:peptidase domain-containing ABC transporter [Ascidiimonas aurantiaca]|uniref:peptidase domain-containing ABC transporter n=1 Tax=Ascidiimonas aurantiaca TaxID=1685432 RepID=UPI0030ED5255
MAKTKIKQHDISDCGAACLASVAAYYKLHLPIARIRQYASTDQKGTNILGLLEAAQKLGFEAKGVRGDSDCLSKIPKPSIAHVIVKNQLQHYVVIYKVNKRYIKIMDPSYGSILKMSHEEFKEIWTGVLVLLIPREDFISKNEKVSVLKRFWGLLRPHKFILLQALMGALVYTLLGFSTSIYIQKITDYVLVNGNTNLLNLLSVLMLFLLFFQVVLGIYKDVFLIKTGQQIDARLILGYYRHLLKLPQSFFDTMRVGEIISRINDAVKIRTFISDVSLNLTVNVMILIFSFCIMFTYYWKLALIVLIIVPLYGIIYLTINKLNKIVERKVMENSASLESQLVGSLNAIDTIKSFGLEDSANSKTEKHFISLLKAGYQSALNSVFSRTGSAFLAQSFTILLLWVGAGYVIDRQITPGELLSFYAIIGYFTGPVSTLISSNKQIQNALIAADRLFEIIDLERENTGITLKLTRKNFGDIKFKNVCFRYGSRNQVFEDFNLEIPKGKITAFVGESGSGKSTLMSLLQNVYPLNKGMITIGKINLQHVDRSNLRSVMTVVPQKIDMFHGNVIDNIAVGEHNPDLERIVNVCADIGILDFIEELPYGFKTYLGENGATLSGGQKQRIAIARALYRQPEILILDEATSSLDTQAEKYIQNVINTLRNQEKTIIIIAHRLSTVISADKIVVLNKGKVIEEGTHQQLYKNQDTYYRLWQQQLPNF